MAPRVFFALSAWVALVSGANAETVQIERARLGLDGERTRVVLDLTGGADYRVARTSEPPQLLIELADTTLTNDPSLKELRGGVVEALSIASLGGGAQRLTLSLSDADLALNHFTLRPDPASGRGHRLVIDLEPGADVLLQATTEPDEVPGLVRASPTANVAEELPDAMAGESGQDSKLSVASTAGTNDGEPLPLDDDLDEFLGIGATGAGGAKISGYFESSAAYTYASPTHWSKLRARLELALTGSIGENVRYKLATRLDGDGAYVVEDDFYPGPVRDDQRFEAQIREFYVDFGGGAWAHRVGRQHIVWGEMVGLFLADVVSARDTREFFLQEFEAMRIPQWAWNTQYFAGDNTLEFVYIPVPSVDNIGEPGADFYAFPLEPGTVVRDERPSRSLSNYNWGVRGSTLLKGWSLSGYYYDSISVAPTLVAEPDGLTLRYDPLEQIGGTFSKDFGGFVFKGEAVFTSDRRFQSFGPDDPTELFTSDVLDWVVGATIPVGDMRVDLQLYGRRSYDYDPGMGFDEDEFGATVLVNYALGTRVELELLALAGLNRKDYLLRPKLAWRFAPNWRLQAGADVFGGSEIGLFGPYDNRDRVYLEVKRWF